MRLGQRFESARRLSRIGVDKPNTRNIEKLPFHRWEHLTPLRYKLRAVSISSAVFLRPEGIQCSADLTLVPASQPIGAASRRIIGNPYTQQAPPGWPDDKARLSQPGWAVYHNVSGLGFALCEAEARGSSTVFLLGSYPSGLPTLIPFRFVSGIMSACQRYSIRR